jgi:hypothetical protein
MWLLSGDMVSCFVSERANNWREQFDALQLLALFKSKNERASDDQCHLRTWIIVYNYSVVMSLWFGDTVSFFVSTMVYNGMASNPSLQLLAVCETMNEWVSEDESHMMSWIILYNYSIVTWLRSSDILSLFVLKRANKWRERLDALQLLAVFETKNKGSSANISDMTTE